MLLSLLVFILVLSFLVIIHELGHFLLAKWTGMRVDEFAIGFPPRIFQCMLGETNYAIGAIPLGGYVKIHGENESEAEEPDPRDFGHRPIWARLLVIVAGVFMNFLFAFLALVAILTAGQLSSSGLGLENIPGAQIRDQRVVVVDVQPNSVAAAAHLQAGDFITQVIDPATGAHKTVQVPADLQSFSKSVQSQMDRHLTIVSERSSQQREQTVQVAATGPALGVLIDPVDKIQLPFWQAPRGALIVIGVVIQNTWQALAGFVNNLFVHARLDQSISGPIGIYHATSTAYKQGWLSVFLLMINLSLSLALLNILPIPPLDGGKVLFLLIELAFRRKIVHPKLENAVAMIGLALLLGLILLVSVNDIRQLL